MKIETKLDLGILGLVLFITGVIVSNAGTQREPKSYGIAFPIPDEFAVIHIIDSVRQPDACLKPTELEAAVKELGKSYHIIGEGAQTLRNVGQGSCTASVAFRIEPRRAANEGGRQ